MDAGRLAPLLDDLDRRMRDPIQLRLSLGVAMVAAWYLAIYAPLSERIEATTRDRGRTDAHLATAKAIVALRAEAEKYRGHLPPPADANEWVEYLVGGVRRFPVKVSKLEPLPMRKHGPFDVLALKLELLGTFAALDGLLAWIEANPRLLRIDAITFEPEQGDGRNLVLRLTVIGIVG
jgi:hypothetical protein